MALPLLRAIVPPKRLIADKAYDARSLRDWLKSHRVIATLPSTATRTVPYKHSRIAYRRRNRNRASVRPSQKLAARRDPL